MLKILLAIKDPSEALQEVIKGHQVTILHDYESLLPKVAKESFNLILLHGLVDVLPSVKAADPRVEVILFGEREEDALPAITQGASAFLPSPVDIERLKETIDSIDDLFAARRESAELERQLSSKYTFFREVVGKNPRMLEIFALVKRIAPYYKTVTITGETGTGKEVIARILHTLSPGGQNPFIVCNCGAIVETLVESDLFGHKKGSFTGAIADKMGLFEAAGEGSIFLDEIADLPPSVQPRLLRVLQDGEFRPLGSNQISKARCRVIAATNKDLSEEVKNRRFREDLFYRLTPLTIALPPLRKRKDDVPLLFRFFLEKFNRRTGKKILGISRPAQTLLFSYDWPGNVRELENVLEQASLLATESFIRLTDLPPYIGESLNKEKAMSLTLDDVVKEHIEAVLKKCEGNRSRAAKMLGISRRALSRKIVKYSLQ